jgi:hypothetical protein
VPRDSLPWLRGPAEWEWGYRTGGRVPLSAVLIALVTVLLSAFSGVSAARGRASRLAASLLLGSAVVLGASFHLALVDPAPLGRLRVLMRRAISASVTSYHSTAVSSAGRDPIEFVRRHADLLPELDHHAATHPPGPVLFYRATVGLCESFPRLTTSILDLAGVPRGESAPPLTRAARAGALLGSVLLDLAGLLVVWPLYRLGMALGLDPIAAARIGLVWTVLPGPTLMPARLDQAIALPVAAYAVLVLSAVRAPSSASRATRCVLAGVSAGVGLFLSYGAALFLVIGGLAVLVTVTGKDERDAPAKLLRWIVACPTSVAVALLVAFGVPAFLGGEPVRAMRVALAIHRGEFTATRSYGLWLGRNLVDFALFVGVPVAILALEGAVASVRRVRAGKPIGPSAAFGLVGVGCAALLAVSGLTRGEVGRLWIPLMPLVLVGALAPGEAADSRKTAALCLLAAAQSIVIGSFWSF